MDNTERQKVRYGRYRIGDYYLESELRIAEAQRALKRMKEAENGTELRASFMVFIELTKNVFQPLHRLNDILPGYQDWWRVEKEILEKNKLAKFFWSKRNDVVKAGNELIELSLRSKMDIIIEGPMLYYDGQVYRPKGNRFVPDHTIFGFELIWDFVEKPIQEAAIFLCEKYLETLEDILDRFMKKYPDIVKF